MNCAECRELLVGYLEGVLDEQQTGAIETHLKDCPACRMELEQTRQLQQRLTANGQAQAQGDLENAVIDAIMRKQAFELRKAGEGKPLMNFWRVVMRNRIAQLAAAAAIIIVAGLAIYYFAGGGTRHCCAWDDIIRPIMEAKTAEFDIIIGDEKSSPLIHDMVMGSRIRRTLAGMKAVSIIDLATGTILTLEPDEKKATFIELKDLPQTSNYMEQLRGVIKMLQDSPHFVVKDLGEQTIDGQVLYGFEAKHPQAHIKVWSDPETALPVRIEQEETQMKVVCRNMLFDVPMDESLFDMNAPEGYKVERQEMKLFGATEEDFIEGLRIQAEKIYDGRLPDDVSVEQYIKMAPALKDKFDKLTLSDEEKTALGMKLSRGLMFIRFFKGEGKWYYAGKGVKLGDEKTAIFWYRPVGSQTYRVIYGDLSIKDVAEKDLPQPVVEKAPEPIGYQQWDKNTFAGGEVDQWHIDANDNIIAHSFVTVTKGPQGVSAMPVKLPYRDGILKSATLGDVTLPFNQTGPGQYDVNLPLEKMLVGETEIEFVWMLPLDGLQKKDYGFQTELASLIPVVSFKLTVVLDDDCGYVYSQDSSQWEFVPFSWGAVDEPKNYFGSCGILIKPDEKQ